MMTLTTRHAQQYRAYVRQQCQAASHVRIGVIDGAAVPEVTGESYHWENASGDRIRHPNAYRRAWGKPIYCASTISVEVGREWLTARHIPVEAMSVRDSYTERPTVEMPAVSMAALVSEAA